jgi:HK97 gp10 family phage protein
MTIVIFGKEELMAKFNALSEAVQGEALSKAALAGATVIVNAAKENAPKRDNHLGPSIHSEVSSVSETSATVDIGTDVVYAAIQEFGGTVSAKNGKYLAIPIGDFNDSPKNHSDLKLRKTGGGNLIMVDASGKAQYVLQTSVTIPPHPYLRPAMDENQQEAMNVIGMAFKTMIDKAVAQ